jgi:hypothetical protein
MTPEMFEDLSACCAVINAFGDSGSPTSWSVLDGFALERAGVPTCTIVTEVFSDKARRETEALGMEALPLIVIPHPVGQLPRDQIARIADRITEDIIFALTGKAAELTSP